MTRPNSGPDSDTGPAQNLSVVATTPTTPQRGVGAAPDATVISVADLLEFIGGTLTCAELPHVRSALRRSSVRDVLGDVVSAVRERCRRELVDTISAFPDPARFHGCFGPTALAALPCETIAGLLTGIHDATGLTLVRVVCGDAARLCVDDPVTGRLFEIGEPLENWLHGEGSGLGPLDGWIGRPIDDLDRDELVATGPHDYLLPDTHTVFGDRYEPSAVMALRVDDDALTRWLTDADWLNTIPVTRSAWNRQWREATRRIIDELGGTEVLVAENLPHSEILLCHQLLTDPVGLEIWAHTRTPADFSGTRLVTIVCQGPDQHYSGDTDSPAQAVVSCLAYLIAELNQQWRAIQHGHGLPTTPNLAPTPDPETQPPHHTIAAAEHR